MTHNEITLIRIPNNMMDLNRYSIHVLINTNPAPDGNDLQKQIVGQYALQNAFFRFHCLGFLGSWPTYNINWFKEQSKNIFSNGGSNILPLKNYEANYSTLRNLCTKKM